MFQHNFDAIVEIFDGDVEHFLVVTEQRERLPAQAFDGGDDGCTRFGAQTHACGKVSERGAYAANEAFVTTDVQNEAGMLRTAHERKNSPR